MLKRSLLLVLLCGTISAAQLKAVRQYPIDMNHSTVGFSVAIMDGLSGRSCPGSSLKSSEMLACEEIASVMASRL
jgi:hypothetical protein